MGGLLLLLILSRIHCLHWKLLWEKVVKGNHISDSVCQSWGGVMEVMATQELKSNVPKIQLPPNHQLKRIAFSVIILFLFSLTELLHWYEWSVPSPFQHGEGHRLRNLLPVHPSALIAYQERLLHQVRASFRFYFFFFQPDDIMVLCCMPLCFDGLAILKVLKIEAKREIFSRLKQLFLKVFCRLKTVINSKGFRWGLSCQPDHFSTENVKLLRLQCSQFWQN